MFRLCLCAAVIVSSRMGCGHTALIGVSSSYTSPSASVRHPLDRVNTVALRRGLKRAGMPFTVAIPMQMENWTRCIGNAATVCNGLAPT